MAVLENSPGGDNRWVQKRNETSCGRQACSLTAKGVCVLGGREGAILTGGFLMWCPPKRHTSRERLVAGAPSWAFQGSI